MYLLELLLTTLTAVLYLQHSTVTTSTVLSVPTGTNSVCTKKQMKMLLPPSTDWHDDGLEEPNGKKRTDQKRRRLAINTLQIKTTLLFLWFGGQGRWKTHGGMPNSSAGDNVSEIMGWCDEMWERPGIRFLVDGHARATNHKNQF